MPALEPAAVIRAYRSGVSIRDIGRRFGFSSWVVWRLLARSGEPRRGRHETRRGATAAVTARDAAVIAAYRAGQSLGAVARSLGISTTCVWNILVRHDESRRGAAPRSDCPGPGALPCLLSVPARGTAGAAPPTHLSCGA